MVRSTITGGTAATGYTMTIAASGLSTSTVAAQNGRTNTSGLCEGCHEVVQSGATQDHHAGECLSCHHADGSWSGTYGAGVGTATVAIDPLSRDSVTTYCLECHATAQGSSRALIVSGTGDNHHRGSSTSTARSVAGCLYCHGEVGGVPFGGEETEAVADATAAGLASPCMACHGAVQSGAAQNHHAGDCLTCHLDSRAPFPGKTDVMNVADSLSRDAVTAYCLACHATAQGSARAIIVLQAQVTTTTEVQAPAQPEALQVVCTVMVRVAALPSAAQTPKLCRMQCCNTVLAAAHAMLLHRLQAELTTQAQDLHL